MALFSPPSLLLCRLLVIHRMLVKTCRETHRTRCSKPLTRCELGRVVTTWGVLVIGVLQAAENGIPKRQAETGRNQEQQKPRRTETKKNRNQEEQKPRRTETKKNRNQEEHKPTTTTTTAAAAAAATTPTTKHHHGQGQGQGQRHNYKERQGQDTNTATTTSRTSINLCLHSSAAIGRTEVATSASRSVALGIGPTVDSLWQTG